MADWCIADMSLEKLTGSIVINHADNFFAFSASSDDVLVVSNALSSGIAGLPGGEFIGKFAQITTVVGGFKMLGCHVSMSKAGSLEVDPTDANVNRLAERASRQRQRTYGRLTAAQGTNSKQLRIKGLQDYLRLESLCQGWVEAFSFCGLPIEDVKSDLDHDLAELRGTFQITDAELSSLKDCSTEIVIDWYSGS